MTAIYTSEEGGIHLPLTIDGTVFTSMPSQIPLSPEPLQDFVNTIDGGSVAFGVYAGAGHADLLDRLTCDLDFQWTDGAQRRALSRMRARGGYRALCLWKPIHAFYTATDSQSQFFIPRYRRNAGQVYSGTTVEGVAINTTTIPFRAWLNDVALTVLYANGPTVATPAVGELRVARDAHTEGVNTGYAEFRIGNTLVAGDVIEIEFTPVYLGAIISPRQEFPSSVVETMSFTFQER